MVSSLTIMCLVLIIFSYGPGYIIFTCFREKVDRLNTINRAKKKKDSYKAYNNVNIIWLHYFVFMRCFICLPKQVLLFACLKS